MWQEIRAALLQALVLHGAGNIRVTQAFKFMQAPAALNIRHGLDVESQRGVQAQAGNTPVDR